MDKTMTKQTRDKRAIRRCNSKDGQYNTMEEQTRDKRQIDCWTKY
jgi:hypothetical protein